MRLGGGVGVEVIVHQERVGEGAAGVAEDLAVVGEAAGFAAPEVHRLDAAEAFQRGLANKVVPLDRLLPEAQAFARELAERSPTALMLSKVALDHAKGKTSSGLVLAYHKLACEACHGDPVYQEHTRAYTQRTKAAPQA